MNTLLLERVSIQGFKAIEYSGGLDLTPLTVFIGNNGSGKSSVIEALETLHTLATRDLDAAMQMWRGFEHIRNRSLLRGRDSANGPPTIVIEVYGQKGGQPFGVRTVLNQETNRLLIHGEMAHLGKERMKRDDDGTTTATGADKRLVPRTLPPAQSLLSLFPPEVIRPWQFLDLSPHVMGSPVAQKLTGGRIRLAKDGSNIAEYLLELRNLDSVAFNDLVETLKVVLPYANDLQTALASDLGRSLYLQMSEADFQIPGWLLSSGTLRVLALLAVLRHPEPPPVIFIEELENGLDPRTLHMIVGEIQRVVASGRSQVIATTHSPYLLDLLPLESIVVVERAFGQPTFRRPAADATVLEWAKEFSPGRLYTMSRFERER